MCYSTQLYSPPNSYIALPLLLYSSLGVIAIYHKWVLYSITQDSRCWSPPPVTGRVWHRDPIDGEMGRQWSLRAAPDPSEGSDS